MGQRDFPVGQRVEHYQKTVSDLDSRFPTQWDKLGEADDLIKEIITILNGGTLQASSQQILHHFDSLDTDARRQWGALFDIYKYLKTNYSI